MKRLALSAVCGFLVPLVYSVIAVLVTAYGKNPILKQLVGIPVRWPLLIYYRIAYLPFPILLVYITACNVLLYGFVTYFVLWRFSKRKKASYPLPPPPPTNFTT
jgi:hypothetical protein